MRSCRAEDDVFDEAEGLGVKVIIFRSVNARVPQEQRVLVFV